MLLDFDLRSIGIGEEKLQHLVRAAALDRDIAYPAGAHATGKGLDVIGLKADMTEMIPVMAGFGRLKEFKECSSASMQKEAVTFAGEVVKFVGNFKAENTDIKSFDGLKVLCIQTDVR